MNTEKVRGDKIKKYKKYNAWEKQEANKIRCTVSRKVLIYGTLAEMG
jgi:hypothetical protein